jgi:hypothetical protein
MNICNGYGRIAGSCFRVHGPSHIHGSNPQAPEADQSNRCAEGVDVACPACARRPSESCRTRNGKFASQTFDDGANAKDPEGRPAAFALAGESGRSSPFETDE